MSLKTPWRGKIVRLLCIAAVGSWAGPASAQDDIIWMDRTPTPPGPSPRFSEMAYNGVLRVTVLVSGYDGTATPHTDTWLWDGTTWTLWTPPLECPDVPAARMAHAMASDAASGLVVLFGGHFPGTGHYFNDTWIWDTHCWTCVIPDNSPGSPPARGCEHAMVYDSRRQVFVLFGGWRDNGLVQYGDTWELSFNGTNWVWEEKCTDPLLRPEKPPARYHHTLAYDAARGETVLFGGTLTDGHLLADDTWVWDGTTWTEKNPLTSPPARFHSGMVYDSARAKVILYGGWEQYPDPGTVQEDTWE